MKHAASWYPNTGIQHTRAVIALAVVTVFLERFVTDDGTELAEHMKIIGKYADDCAVKTRKKALSGGAKRDISNAAEVLAPYFSTKITDPQDRFRQWCAIVWCAMTFIEDVIATCPVYCSGAEGGKWQRLHAAVEALGDALVQLEPGIDEYGTMIYERGAWELEGVEFAADDRDMALV